MDYFFLFDLFFNIILISIGTVFLLNTLYTTFINNNFIVKVNTNKGFTIFWVVMLIIFCLQLFFNIRAYLNNSLSHSITDILFNIYWIEFSIAFMIKSFRDSGITEKGIYKSGMLFKWSKIESYSWTSENTIRFKVRSLFKKITIYGITINEEYKSAVEEVLQRNLSS